MSTRLVYSTDAGRICPDCRQPVAQCRCKALAAAARPAGDGIARVSRERQGRGGKTVTVVRGLPLAEAELQALGKQLRAACGSGGTAKQGVLEIQGDHRDRVLALLQQQGFKAKAAGG
jgi:translation initiation factor 1